MRHVGSLIVKLNPAYNAVLREVLGSLRFVDAQVLGKALAKLTATEAAAALATILALKISQGHPKSLARFDVVGSGKIGIGEQEDSRARWGFVSLVERVCCAGHKAAEYGFQLAQAGSKGWIS